MLRAVLCIVLSSCLFSEPLAAASSKNSSAARTRSTAGKRVSSKAPARKAARPGPRNKHRGKKSPARKPAAKPNPVLDDPAYPLTAEGRVLARTLASLWTREAGRLVSVVTEAWSEQPDEPPLTLMLAIAHAETNGRILLVSGSGAAGLAQATPIAYLRGGGKGRIFITDDYATGAWAYIMKKPLDDADRIASLLLADSSPSSLVHARGLLDAAFAYRGEGMDELRVLAMWARPGFEQRIATADAENQRVLEQLRALLDAGAPKEALVPFREMARDRYRALRELQRRSWRTYQLDLARERDAILREHPTSNAYEAGEILATKIDVRFSPRQMAHFLRDHLQLKMDQARELAADEGQVERITAGLYNGGSHNVKRMLAGLIPRLPETENYMRKVPATARKLEAALAGAPRAVAAVSDAGPMSGQGR